MREYSVPATYSIADDHFMGDPVLRNERDHPGAVLFLIPTADGGWSELTAAEFAREVRAVAKGLIAAGLEVGDRVSLMSDTRYEWILLDYAIWFAGGVTVAIYASSAADQVRWVVEDSGSELLVVETGAHLAIAEQAIAGLPVRETLHIDGGAITELITRGAEVPDNELAARRARLGANSDALVIYTSGTTGKPKGVPLTHGNLAAMAECAPARVPELLRPNGRTLLFLPLAHILAHATSLAAVEHRFAVAHTSDWTDLPAKFAALRPTGLVAVPRVFEKIYNGAEQKAHDNGKGAIFDRASDVAIAWSRSLDAGGPGLLLRWQHLLFDKLVYGKLRAALGGRCTHAISGGAPLGARLAHFYRGVGVNIAEGYGLTETTAAITLNGNQARGQRLGSVGRPFDGHTVRLADDGELLVRGPVVFQGYWRNPQATAESFTDGWFHTGDLAALDADGYVTITGRKKEILVTAAGKNVSPAPLEDGLRAHPLIGQCMVIGDAQPFIAALITLDRDALPGWRERHGLDGGTGVADLISHPDLIAEINAAVAQVNATVSKAEQIKKIRILDAEWSQETGELTPKLSLKRPAVLKRHEVEIDALYA
ncbi:long-chain acyl-CoA synthetase [Nocardia transvalensis]|uniref:Acyl-CoA synthetase n=1 Tax=Nocardia transvalensis TaxID=37333 RepID=A0A7W9PGP1_9NOCA|nr:long-chain fatty acid--CoA ligase [Nocardia transvalensis]MBB5915696.1 long-chain acyl-CoA synthetase [Nocardia transvalensis]